MPLFYNRSSSFFPHYLATILIFLNCHILCNSDADILVSKVAFGSCNRQNKPQNHWDKIGATEPDLYLWTGDSVYSKNNSLAGLAAAFESLVDNAMYRAFRADVEIDGIWDDHDMGVNDGGKYVTQGKERQQMFMKYVTQHKAISASPPDDGRDSILLMKTTPDVMTAGIPDVKGEDCASNHQIKQTIGYPHSQPDVTKDGLHKVMDRRFGVDGPLVRFILLDTRSHRDNHYIRSLGEIKLPLTPLIAAFIRAAYSVLGVGREHKGDMLGERQWQWFESVLRDSPADFHVIVSSIQVLTSNPVVESWGHFPKEKKRLTNLLQKLDPPGLVFLSGDVHHGELSRARVIRSSREDVWVEVTSSGLTHTCGDSFINRILCPNMLRMFSKHRLPYRNDFNEELISIQHRKNDSAIKEMKDNFYIGKNFGLIVDASNTTMFSLNISVISLESDRAKLTHIVHSTKYKCQNFHNDRIHYEEDGVVRDASECDHVSDPIIRIISADFPNLVAQGIMKSSELIAVLVGIALLLISSLYMWKFTAK